MFLFWSLIFIASLCVLIKSANYFTDLAEKLGLRWGLSLFLVGALILTFGTTLPELSTSLISVLKGQTEMVSGSIMGTVITNILLGFGLAPLIWKKNIQIKFNLFHSALPFLIAAVLVATFAARDGLINRFEGVLFIIGFLAYSIYSCSLYNSNDTSNKTKSNSSIKIIFLIIVSLFAVFLSSKYVVESLIKIAEIIGRSAEVLAASALAIGTSLPEIAIALICAKKEKFDLTAGNIIGACIYDVFFIIGICSLIAPLIIPPIILSLVIPYSLIAVVLYWLLIIDKKITPLEGGLMLLSFIFYLAKLFSWF